MKILVIQIKRIGDVLLTTPALAALRHRFPEATIDVLVDHRWAEVLEGVPMISRVLPYDADHPVRWLWRVRQARYDWVIDFLNNPRSALLSILSGAPVRAGFRVRGWRWCYTQQVPFAETAMYAAAQKLQLIKALGVPCPASGAALLPTLALSAEDQRFAEEFLTRCGFTTTDRLVALAPMHRRPSRQWRLDHCVRLGELFTERWDARVLWLGAPDELPRLHELTRQMRCPSWVTPPIRLRQAAALLARCHLAVSSDSGMRHLAVAVGTPSLAIHGPALPIHWTPPDPRHRAVHAEDLWCLGCDLNHCPYHHECMAWVDAEQVFRVCEELMNQVTAGGGPVGSEGTRGDLSSIPTGLDDLAAGLRLGPNSSASLRSASSDRGGPDTSSGLRRQAKSLQPGPPIAPSSALPGSATEAPAIHPLGPPSSSPYVIDDRTPFRKAKNSRLLHGVTRVAALGYGTAIKARDAAFTAGWVPVHRLPVPTICVGNLTAGGTGKTPTVIRLVEDLLRWGRHPAVLSRGYGRAGSLRRCLTVRDQHGRLRAIHQVGEEPWLIARRFPGVPVVVGSDRVQAAHVAMAHDSVDCVVLDDGFQHRWVARDLDVVVVNALDPLGKRNRLLPAGMLREPPEAVARAGLVILTHVGLASPTASQAAKVMLRRYLRDGIPIIEASHEPVRLTPLRVGGWPAESSLGVETLRGRQIIACSALGFPQGFEYTLQRMGAMIQEAIRFPDHHWFSPQEWEAVVRLASPDRWVILTEKDALHVPVGAMSTSARPVLILEITLAILQGADEWERIIRSSSGLKQPSPEPLLV